MRDPTHPYTWLPLPAPSWPQGLPRGGAEEKGLGGGLPESHWVPPTSTWQRQLPPQRQAWWLVWKEPPFPRGSSKDSRPGPGEWGRGWFVRNRVYVRGTEDLGVVLGPLVRGTELGLEILGPRAFCSLELGFLVHIMGRQRGDIVLRLWKQEVAWGVRKKLSPKSNLQEPSGRSGCWSRKLV